MNIYLIGLLHDMMKPDTYKIRDGRDTYYNHDILSLSLAKELKKELVLSNKEYKFLQFVVKNHHLFKMCNLDNKKTIFNVAFEMRKNKYFFEKIKPILYGDFFNGEMSKEKDIEFETKYLTIQKAIKRIDDINNEYDWKQITSNLSDKNNLSDKIRKILKKHFVNGYIRENEIKCFLRIYF